MKKTFYVFISIVLFLLSTMYKQLRCAQPVVPTFYQNALIHQPYPSSAEKWQTTLAATLQHSYAHKSFNKHEDKKPLFDVVGATKLTHLGLNLENISASEQPKTYYYWFNNGPFSNPSSLNLQDDDGLLSIKGAFHSVQATVILKQNLPWNLYFLVSLPIREVKAHKVSYQLHGATTINNVNMQDFVNNDLPLILSENDLKPLTEIYKETGLADSQCAVGWYGKTSNKKGLIKSLQGSVQASCILPIATEQDIDHSLSIPLGHNKHIGFGFQATLDATLRNILTIGCQMTAYVFLKNDQTMHLKTDKAQQGLVILEKSRINLDPGSNWALTGYLAFDQFVKNLSVMVGYSFTQQEKTSVEVEDSNYLKTLIKNADGSKAKPFVSQDDYANTDTRFYGWTMQTLHAAVSYQCSPFTKQKIQPLLALEYSYPIAGKRIFTTETFGGTLGVSCSFSF